ncbi:uncharacterized protein [Clytia hemisphaerica]|uniref:Mutator-like transposase domain-containing protein n=1 Tax=Clytia hemisphaerica TaxID=252671 RepID=A0A7M5X0I9_9CNID|eukprot:TCONS_00041644-protein
MGKLKSRTARKYKPKRKFYGNRYTLSRAFADTNEDTFCSSQEESRSVVTSSSATFPVTVEEPGPSAPSQSTLPSSTTPTDTTTDSINPPLVSASSSKINPLLEEDTAPNNSTDDDGLSGFRLMDTSILNDIIRKLPCPDCFVNDLKLIEQKSKNGFASEFTLKCSASNKCGKAFEVNRRIVYSMRQVGVGYAVLSKFSSYMNMPSSMCKTTYNKVNYVLKTAAETVKPIYNDLSQPSLLSKFLHGKTQNANESFHGMIWNRIPKTCFVGRNVFELGVYDAICHFNVGTKAAIEIFK